MAGVTVVGSINVPGIFTTGCHAIMTGDTVTDKATVINRGNRRPVCCYMATVTFQRGL